MKNTLFLMAVAAVLFLGACGDAPASEGSGAANALATSADTAKAAADGLQKLLAMFPEINKADMHVPPCLDTVASREAGLAGTQIPAELLEYFDRDRSTFYKSSGKPVYAVGQYKGMYLIRVPGEAEVTDVDLAMPGADGKLNVVTTLAYSFPKDGDITQQDGWIRDVNNDGKQDYVTRAVTILASGKPEDETFKTYLQMPDGTFVDTTVAGVKKEVFKRTKLK